ncbi:MAG TPA: ATP-binding protein [Gemmatimonadaceae bacterium]
MSLSDLFDSLDATRIAEYIRTQQEEHLLLDFKTASRSDLSGSDDRKNFAKALSGFANSDGGLIVWGVDARKLKPDGPDCATAEKEIDNLPLFVSRLNEFTGSFVRPLVEGVRHRAVPTVGSSGFAITIVPESDTGPHMALGGEGRYYKRSGSSFYPMEHFDIEDMFGRRRKPRLDVEFTIGSRGSSRSNGVIEHKNPIGVFVSNRGRGSATNLFARLTVSEPFVLSPIGPEADGRGGLPRISEDGNRRASYSGRANVVVHPGMRQGIAAVGVTVSVGQQQLADLEVVLETAADGIPLTRSTHRLSGTQIRSDLGNFE